MQKCGRVERPNTVPRAVCVPWPSVMTSTTTRKPFASSAASSSLGRWVVGCGALVLVLGAAHVPHVGAAACACEGPGATLPLNLAQEFQHLQYPSWVLQQCFPVQEGGDSLTSCTCPTASQYPRMFDHAGGKCTDTRATGTGCPPPYRFPWVGTSKGHCCASAPTPEQPES